jgi:hypothetical protein
MTDKINLACVQIAAVVRSVSNIRQVHDYAPDNPNAYPMAIVYPGSGKFDNYAIGTQRSLSDITIDVLEPMQMQSLPRFMAAFTPLVDSVPAALLAEMAANGSRFGATLETFDRIDYSFLPRIDYAADPMRGYRFVMRGVKILT